MTSTNSTPIQIYPVGKVFVAGGLPTITYNPRPQLDLEGQLRDALHRLTKIILVAGATKSGKTVLVRKVLPETEAVWVEGGAIVSENDFWTEVVSQLGASLEETQSAGDGTVVTTGDEGSVGAKPFGIGAEGKRSSSYATANSYGRTVKRTMTPRAAALKALKEHEVALVIDDFHYIPRTVQTSIVRALKQPVFDGLKVVLLAVPHRTADAVKAESEVEGRVATITVPDWQETELKEVADAGFKALQLQLDAAFVDSLVKGAFASPHLLQDLCSLICKNNGIVETANPPMKISSLATAEDTFRQLATDMNPSAFTKIRKGPARTNRVPRSLKNGKTCDIYEAVLWAIIETGPTTKIVYNDLATKLKEILVQNAVPQQHEITRVLEQMAAQKVSQAVPPLDYDKEFKEMHITDPFFRFFLKWGVDRTWK